MKPVQPKNTLQRVTLVAQLVKNPHAMQETLVWFLGQEDPLEKGTATHSSILGLSWSLRQQRIHLLFRRPGFSFWIGKVPWRRNRLPTPVFLDFPGGSNGKESTHNAGDLGLIPGLGRSPGGAHGNPLHYSCLENPQGQRSLVGCSTWGYKESEMTEWLSTRIRGYTAKSQSFYEMQFTRV